MVGAYFTSGAERRRASFIIRARAIFQNLPFRCFIAPINVRVTHVSLDLICNEIAPARRGILIQSGASADRGMHRGIARLRGDARKPRTDIFLFIRGER